MVPPRSKDLPPGDRPVVLASVVGAHGIAGEVRLKVFAEDLDRYRSFNDGRYVLRSIRHGANGAIARFAGINDRDGAESLRGIDLTVPRSDLPPLADDEYYHSDLIGLRVVAASGSELGMVVAVANFGAGDVVEVERSDGKRFMVPMRPEAVPHWDAATMTIAEPYID